MKFIGKTDINASLNDTFAVFADFGFFESIASKSGAKTVRTDELTAPGPGMSWQTEVDFRGKPRKLQVELVDYDPPHSLNFMANSDRYKIEINVALSRSAAKWTDASLKLDVSAKSITGRITLQSARVKKKALQARFQSGVDKLGLKIMRRTKPV
ncbi:MAG: hypothetical protein GXP05_00070 [Alphaproteobacteria bacterium]|nr:hypothetical protein [Alphaproteobacteria bacterium]